MQKKLKKIYKNEFIKYFILMQPLIDIITSLMIRCFNMPLSLGIIIRGLFLIYAVIYLFFLNRNEKKKHIIYIIVTILFCFTSLIINMNLREINIFSEVSHLFKLVYFPIVLLFFFSYFKNNKFDTKVFNYIILFIGLSMLVAFLTDTYILSYGSIEEGHSGWFNSANELGAILGILFPFVVYEVLKKVFPVSLLWITLLLIIFSMFSVGTKVAFLAMILTILGLLAFYFIEIVFYKIKIKTFKIRLNFLISVFIVILLIIPYTPITNNINITIGELNLGKIFNTFKPGKEEEPVNNTIFNGREKYLKEMKKVYNSAPMVQKIFGVGRTNLELNGKEVKEFIERDFYDVFYYHGIVGFIIFMYPIIYTFIKLINVFSVLKFNIKKLDDKCKVMIISITLFYLIAHIAGHTLLSPAVCTFGALIIALFYRELYNKIDKQKLTKHQEVK